MANNKDFRVKNNLFVKGLGTSTFSGDVSVGDTITIQGAATFNDEVNLTSAVNASAITTSGNVIIGGDLTVNGTTTTVDTNNLNVKDKNITLNYSTGDSSALANGAGITIQDAVNSTTDATMLWDSTNDQFDFSHTITLPDSQAFKFGDLGDLSIEHNSAGDSVINNFTGDLYITNKADDKDIIFRTDDGSGGFTSYLQLDGSDSRIAVFKETRFYDNVKAVFGNSADLQIYHDTTNSVIWNQTGHLTIQNSSDDKDIIFKSDDGSGGVTEYFRLDGGNSNVLFSKTLKIADATTFAIGDNNDFQVSHNGTNTFMSNNTGIFYITQNTDDANFLLRADNGSGGVANYVVLKGSTGEVLLNHYGNNRFKTTSSGVNVMNGGLFFAGTQVITSARNLVNVGTINSGAITSSGNIIGSGNLQIDTDTFVVVASNNSVGIGTDSPASGSLEVNLPAIYKDTATFEGNTVFNEASSANADFRVESDSNTHALFVDSSTNRVGILNSTPSTVLDVTGGIKGTSLNTTGKLEVVQSTTGSASGGIRFLVGGVADSDGNNFKLEAPTQALDMGLQSASGVEINVGATDTGGGGDLSLAKYNFAWSDTSTQLTLTGRTRNDASVSVNRTAYNLFVDGDDTGFINHTFFDSVSIKSGISGTALGTLQLFEASNNGTNYVALRSPTSLSSNVTFTLPSADGSANQVLKTDGSGNLSFVSESAATTINNNADNRIITGSGTANTLNAQSLLTFGNSTGSGSNSSLEISGGSTHPPVLSLLNTTGSSTTDFATISHDGANTVITSRNGSSRGGIKFQGTTGLTPTVYGSFDASGNFEIGTTDVIQAGTRNLVNIGTISSGAITSSGVIESAMTGNAKLIADGTTHANVEIDRGNTSSHNNLIYRTAGAVKWRIWQDGADNILKVRNEVAGTNVLTFTDTNSSFAGTISSGAITSTGVLTINEELSGDTSQLVITNTQGATLRMGITGSGSNQNAHIKTNSAEDLEFHIGQASNAGTPDITFLSNNGGIAIQGTTIIDSSRNLQSINQATITEVIGTKYRVKDSRNVATTTDEGNRQVRFDFKANNNGDNLSDGGSFHGQMLFQQWNDSSGGDTHALGFTDNGNIWHRRADIGGTWDTWYKIVETGRSMNVSLGTISSGAITSSGNLDITSASSPKITLTDTTNSCNLLMYAQDSNSHIGTYSNHLLAFDTNSTTRMVIKAGGDVGIGTSSPNTELEVKGGSGVNTTLRISTDGTATPNPKIELYRNASAYGEIKYNPGGSVGGESGLVYTDFRDDTSSKHIWRTRGVEKLRLDSVGNLNLATGDLQINGITVINSSRNLSCGVINSTGKHTFNLASGVNGNIIQLARSAGAYAFNIGISSSSVFQINDNNGSTQLLGIAPSTGNATFAGDIDLADDKRIKLGNGNDLQIFHNSSNNHSIIQESGSGNLRINADDLIILNSAVNETKASFLTDGSVRLFHNNIKKFETTSTGVDVTGFLTATSAVIADTIFPNTSNANFEIKNSSENVIARFNNDLSTSFLGTISASTATFSTALDASITVQSTDATTGIVFTDNGGTGHLYYLGGSDKFYTDGKLAVNGSTLSGGMAFQVNGNSNFAGTITSSGDMAIDTDTLFVDVSTDRVGINTSAPSYALHVAGSGYFADPVYAQGFSGVKQGDANIPANTAGYFKIAEVVRGTGTIQLSFTGGNFSPTTYVIHYFKNWSTSTELKLNKYGVPDHITKARIRKDSDDNDKYFVEVYFASNSNAPTFQVYHNQLDGYYNGTNQVFTGTLTAGSTNGVTYAEEDFVDRGMTMEQLNVTKINSNAQTLIIGGTAGTSTVGIGDTSPAYALEVNEASNYAGVHIRGSNAPNVTFGRGTNSTQEWKAGISGNSGTSFSISKGTGAADKLTIDTNGDTVFAGTITSGGDVIIPDKISHTGDSDTYMQFNASNSWRVVTGDVERLKCNSNGVIINDVSVDVDFRVESNNSGSMLFVDGGLDRVGIGTGSPSQTLHVAGGFLTTGTATIGDSSADALVFTGELKQGLSGGTTVIDSSRNFLAGSAYKIGNNKVIEQVGTRLNIGDVNSNDYIVDITAYGDTSSIVMNDGFIDVVGDFDIAGALSKNSGSFKIDHPLKPDSHHLVHSFVEGPQADNLYRGTITLQDGRAVIDLDEWFGMTPGTFLALNRDIQAFVSNIDDWDAVRAKMMGSQLLIECQNAESKASVSWMVVGERQDKEIYASKLTDDNGKIIVEPLKEVVE